MTYFSRYILAPLAVLLAGLSVALVPAAALAHDGGTNDAERVASVIPATPSLALFIGPDGSALVRGAKVLAVNSSAITVTTSWGSSNLTWTLHTASSTTFSTVSNTAATSAVILVGDIVSFKGTLDQTGSAFVVNVMAVRDWSTPLVNPITVKGAVSSVNTANGTFVLKGTDTVTVVQAAGVNITLNGTTTPFASITSGSKVTVTGTYGASTKTITATTIAITSPEKKRESFSWNDFVKNVRLSFAEHGKK